MNDTTMRSVTKAEWDAEGTRLYGPDKMKWRFVCPACGHVATPQDWKDAGSTEGAVAFSCVGRFAKECREAFDDEKPGPCNYAGGGLFRLNPVSVDGDENRIFEFADHANSESVPSVKSVDESSSCPPCLRGESEPA